MTATVVPYEDPEQTQILYEYETSPYSHGWWQYQTLTNIPEQSIGWLAAQGWQITTSTLDTTTKPHTPTFALARQSLQNWNILQSLLDQYIDTYNTAMANNTIRYNDVIEDWTEALESSHTHFTNEISTQNTHTTSYLSDVDTYMDAVEALVNSGDYETDVDNVLNDLSDDFAAHEPAAKGFLDDLGATEEARIIEKYAASLATQTQDLTDRGLYSSDLISAITQRNLRDREEEITALKDSLNRQRFDNQHRTYEQQVALRQRTLAGHEGKRSDVHREIAGLMGSYTARLQASASKHAEDMQLMMRQLQVRNELLVGLYGFVERRDDVVPEFSQLVSIATGLGDAGGGWVTP
jgi:hypothetical protein